MNKETIDAIAGEDLQAGQLVVTDFARLEEKVARFALGYRSGKSVLAGQMRDALTYGTAIHDAMVREDPTPPKRQRPWKKGFIPTVGKVPDLPAPVLPGWELATRTGNEVTYYEKDKAPNWMFAGTTSIVGHLAKRQWAVFRVEHEVHDSFTTTAVFSSSNPDACLLYLALEDKPKEPNVFQQLKDYCATDIEVTSQLDAYRNLFTNTGRYRKP